MWAVATILFVAGIAYLLYREHRRSGVFLCNTDDLWCSKGVCPGEGNGADCFERETAWCSPSKETKGHCFAAKIVCEDMRRDHIEVLQLGRPPRSLQEMWEAGEAVGQCVLTRASEL